MRHGCDIDGAQDRDNTGGVCPESSAPQASKLVVHDLAAADYSLGSPDFSAPAVHEVTPLTAVSYTLEPLDFRTPALGQAHALTAVSYTLEPLAFNVLAWKYGYRISWVWAGSDVDLGGRPLEISEDAEARMIAAVRGWLAERGITDLKHVSLAHRAALKRYVRGLADDEGVQVADSTLHKRIIKPAARAATKI